MFKALVTGGAGFIGSHLVEALLRQGCEVCVLDNLHPQIHGPRRQLPDYFAAQAHLVFGDVGDEAVVRYALQDVDVVFHLAAETGVGQSMYQAGGYVRTNVVGTATLWDALHTAGSVQKLVLASSRAVYGEGTVEGPDCGRVRPEARREERLARGQWAPQCPRCGAAHPAVATSEEDVPRPTSVYGITKLAQEQLCLTLGQSTGIPVVILRFFNVYGSRQALSNPYTGILTTFLARLCSGKPLLIYEDGGQWRDFVHVTDVVQACLLAAGDSRADFQVFNVGSGQPLSILQLARALILLWGDDEAGRHVQVTGHYRAGDIRDCVADISKIGATLGYAPSLSLAQGLREFLDWADSQQLVDRSDEAAVELASASLLRRASG